jgi:hypothetical protein
LGPGRFIGSAQNPVQLHPALIDASRSSVANLPRDANGVPYRSVTLTVIEIEGAVQADNSFAGARRDLGPGSCATRPQPGPVLPTFHRQLTGFYRRPVATVSRGWAQIRKDHKHRCPTGFGACHKACAELTKSNFGRAETRSRKYLASMLYLSPGHNS